MISSKECFKCKTVKPLEEFYKHPRMGDGHLNKCKSCTKSDANKNRQDNLEARRDYDRQRSKLAHRMELKSILLKSWRTEDLRRQRCHNAVRTAILNGKLVKFPCERCGEVKSLAHHEDYDKPLDVMWLCQPCHKQRHKELKEEF